MVPTEYFLLYSSYMCIHFISFTHISHATASSARMDMLLRGNLRRGVGLCIFLLVLVNEATGQRRKTRLRNNYRLHDDGGNGNCLYEVTGKIQTLPTVHLINMADDQQCSSQVTKFVHKSLMFKVQVTKIMSQFCMLSEHFPWELFYIFCIQCSFFISVIKPKNPTHHLTYDA